MRLASSLIVAAAVAATGTFAMAVDRTTTKAEHSYGVRADHVATPVAGSTEATFTLDINLAGWVANGDFTDPTNTQQTFNLIPNAYITGIEWIGLNFDSINGSYRSEFAISTNQSSNTGAAGTFWDHRPASQNSPGNYTGSGAFTNPSNQYVSGPFQLLADGALLVYVYEDFDDVGVQDAVVNAGTLRVTYSDEAPPPPPAPTTLFSADLSPSDPTFNRPVSLTALSGVGTAVYHDVTAFTVSATGSYTIEQQSGDVDSHMSIYSGSFSAGSPLTNLIGTDDDGGALGGDSLITLNLTAGTTYYLVNASFGNGEVGDYDVVYTGAGLIVVPEPVSLAGLMGAGLLLRRRRA